ncbi:MAG: hypothetical protein IPK63_19915 [Candidatus Competibacteraceae bacterium]|nr:hypothetical protein [Candidatus Competibacteraceae bacterium]
MRPNGAELSDTRAWVERTECAIPQAGVAAKLCRSNGGMDGASRRTNPVRSTLPDGRREAPTIA